MPITLVEITTVPIATNSAATEFEDRDYATLEFTDTTGVVARPRVPLADLGVSQTKEELLLLIEQEGAQAVSMTLQV